MNVTIKGALYITVSIIAAVIFGIFTRYFHLSELIRAIGTVAIVSVAHNFYYELHLFHRFKHAIKEKVK